ncbi:hypothetical protein GCM10010358_63140 [Streptomyces minutiscleroticus]|uniref:Uncharacterized protein n=1 Tax=Streptomyces minutiscleroticus TaxID=68238 RepID=A0A918U6P9_9ACTN|nr:hypothetical protein GCM10010358_63140 [Streptomyces minutiscleroticus]
MPPDSAAAPSPTPCTGAGGTPTARNLLSQAPKSAQPWVATLLRTVFEQPDADTVQAQLRHALHALEAKFPRAAAHPDAAQHDLPAFTALTPDDSCDERHGTVHGSRRSASRWKDAPRRSLGSAATGPQETGRSPTPPPRAREHSVHPPTPPAPRPQARPTG